jgi:hypothetical protein
VVPINHCGSVAHLLAERVDVSAQKLELKGSLGVTRAEERPVLCILVLQQACITHQPPKSAVQSRRLAAVTHLEQMCGKSGINVVERLLTNVFPSRVETLQHGH